MKKLTISMALVFLLTCAAPTHASAQDLLVPVGQVVGLELKEDAVTVASFDDTLGAGAKQAGLREGDILTSVNGAEIHQASDVREALSRSDGAVDVVVQRGGKTKKLHLTPQATSEGPRLGVYLREGITGIGTVTWYDPDTGSFGTLGHGVSDPGGQMLEMTSGSAYRASVASVKKGKAGEPGQLRGSLAEKETLGQLTANTGRGVFGTTKTGWLGEAVPVASPDEIKTGDAVIRSTVAGETTREYSVEILKIYPKSGESNRNLLLRVTDPKLLETTGGIVQGMSGSPILQDGKLVGAVTHVLVNDPTTGYGIFIENMLDAAA